MSLLVVGSVARDTIRTPHGEVQDTLGGAAVYFSLAACNFTPVRLVGVVGDDFSEDDIALLGKRDIDLAGLQVVEGGRTFRWSGEYSEDMNSRETLSVELNVFEHFEPVLPADYTDSSFVFLANASPTTQLSVLGQVESPVCVMADTMDLWIEIARDELGISTVERPLDRTELFIADELFLVGTGAQISPVCEIDGRTIGTGEIGSITRALQDLYFDIVRGRNPAYRAWCLGLQDSTVTGNL